MARVNLGKVVPQKGVDYMTPAEQQTFVRDITSDVQSELNPYITEKETEIEGVASSATSTFNHNATEKTDDFDSNYTSKLADFNQNAEEKKEELEIELTDYSLITETGSKIVLDINSSNFKIKAILKDKNNNTIDTSNEIDLPLESVVVNASYDSTTKEIVLTLQNGNTTGVSVADLITGLENTANKVTTITSSSTDTQYPSAKAVYDLVDSIVGDINDILDDINGEVI